MVKNLPVMWQTWVWSLGWKDPLEEDMATHSSILVWRIPWTEEPGGLWSVGSQSWIWLKQLGTHASLMVVYFITEIWLFWSSSLILPHSFIAMLLATTNLFPLPVSFQVCFSFNPRVSENIWYLSSSVWFISTYCRALKVHPCCHKWPAFVLSYDNNIPHM